MLSRVRGIGIGHIWIRCSDSWLVLQISCFKARSNGKVFIDNSNDLRCCIRSSNSQFLKSNLAESTDSRAFMIAMLEASAITASRLCRCSVMTQTARISDIRLTLTYKCIRSWTSRYWAAKNSKIVAIWRSVNTIIIMWFLLVLQISITYLKSEGSNRKHHLLLIHYSQSLIRAHNDFRDNFHTILHNSF